jgi:cyclopropane-fatty-acyl-phospholipid synthase
VRGSYDKIISIEMLEAVGHDHLGSFFAICDNLLKTDGLAVIQVITIPDARYDTYRSEANWINKHIFPGGHLPSLTAICKAMAAQSRLQVEHIENIGTHYAETLKHWRQRFIAAKDGLTKMGFDRTLQRKWIYYFSICEAQFGLRVLNNLQIVLTREGNRALINEGWK